MRENSPAQSVSAARRESWGAEFDTWREHFFLLVASFCMRSFFIFGPWRARRLHGALFSLLRSFLARFCLRCLLDWKGGERATLQEGRRAPNGWLVKWSAAINALTSGMAAVTHAKGKRVQILPNKCRTTSYMKTPHSPRTTSFIGMEGVHVVSTISV